jgi:predicted sugar kinase
MLTIKHATRPIKGIETHISQIVRNFMRSQTLPFFSVSFDDGGATIDGGGGINFG